MIHIITPDEPLTLARISEIIAQHATLELGESAVERIEKCRDYLNNKMQSQKEPIYGVTTGFGSLCNISIDSKQLSQLQQNLVMSHACGVGDEVPQEVVKLMLLLKIQNFCFGYSGVQIATAQRLVDCFNDDILPVVYQQGSLGASGDLCPLANLMLPAILGMGEVYYKGRRCDVTEIYNAKGWKPVTLQSKEGLALLNGTQFMSAYAVWSLLKAHRLSRQADMILSLSLDAFDGRIEPFYEALHRVRPHKGQLQTAEAVRRYTEGSQLIKRHKEHVQDPYSFRCAPQVHGAAKDAIAYVTSVVEVEINSTTDNPIVLPDEDMVISGGHFHGEPLAMALDFLAIALSELGSISERRTYQLIDAKRGLPSFLVAKPGLNSGFMIPQYTAAAIASQNKQLCTPCSVDSIPSSQNQEDLVSMGGNAATKCYRVAENTERILAIELFNAAQALEFRRPMKSSPFLESMVKEYRKTVNFVDNDQVMFKHIHASVRFLQEQALGE
ncbi:MAG: histidine ammonia-lyase [bacterium P3]|nr:MAG: histidine ammonia-lyase [bacterium P3]KWW42123.1 MAG: histidine ammonia-lyase [bacterium F083]